MITQQIYIDSSQRDSGSNENFTVGLERGLDRVVSYKIKDVHIPFSYYVVGANSNSLTFNDGSDRNVSVASGNYDGDTLAAALQTVMNGSASALTFTVTYDSLNYKFTIAETSGPTTFAILWSSVSGLGTVLGYDTSANDTGDSTYISDFASQLSGPDYLLLRSNSLGAPRKNVFNESFSSHILKIPVNVSAGSTIFYDGRWDEKKPLYISANQLDFAIFDNTGTVLDLNGREWGLTLELYVESGL